MTTLVIGYKNYSSWSLRPWLALKAAGIAFEEKLIVLNQPDTKAKLLEVSPAGLVPVLIDDDGLTIWDSLAIIEWAAENAKTPLWPEDPKARAIARSVSAEMHSGFYQLRKHCPMNIRRINPPRERDEAVMKDVQRIDGIWNDCRNRFGANGPFLFGAFSGADCMYAPVVTRVRSFSLPVSDVSKAYMDAVLNHPAFLEWEAASKVEPWTNPNSEVD
ncbi:MAG: glutathione S-transferase family protein [Tepidamorphaceae bacterium]|nr:glutathione S-transferase family protein [Rhodobiaceae bacterium]MCC0047731.1 glutathione S-transferase family protein [Rhodobiaceae bacterium]